MLLPPNQLQLQHELHVLHGLKPAAALQDTCLSAFMP